MKIHPLLQNTGPIERTAMSMIRPSDLLQIASSCCRHILHCYSLCPSNKRSNDQRHMPPGHTRHHRRIAHSQGLVRGITFFCAVLVVILVMRMFVVSLIRASQRRREIERQIQEASQRQQGATVYEDNNELNEL
jgi:hypothetical protein